MKTLKNYSKFIFEKTTDDTDKELVYDKKGNKVIDPTTNKPAFYNKTINPVFWEIEEDVKLGKFKPYKTVLLTHESTSDNPLKKRDYLKVLGIGISGVAPDCNIYLRINSIDQKLYVFIYYNDSNSKIKNKLPILGQDDEDQIQSLLTKNGFKNIVKKLQVLAGNNGYTDISGEYTTKLQITNFLKELEKEGIVDESNTLFTYDKYIQKESTTIQNKPQPPQKGKIASSN